MNDERINNHIKEIDIVRSLAILLVVIDYAAAYQICLFSKSAPSTDAKNGMPSLAVMTVHWLMRPHMETGRN